MKTNLSAVERLVLFVFGLHKTQAPTLLEGVCDSKRPAALRLLAELGATDSATRQARLAREFGDRPDASERMAMLLAEAPPALRLELRSPRAQGPGSATRLWAERLALEATR